MNLNQLKIFYLAVKHGNLSTAGRKRLDSEVAADPCQYSSAVPSTTDRRQHRQTEGVGQHAGRQQQSARTEDHKGIKQGIGGQLALAQLGLDPAESLPALRPRENGAYDTGHNHDS